jgi:hypothetical protein
MDFKAFYDTVKLYALNTKNVESYYIGDVYNNWNSLNVKYGSFDININYIRRVDGNDVLNVSMYFAEKLKNDSSNVFDAQSDGFNVIMNVINHLKDDYDLDSYEEIQIYPFWQQFSDILAGAYADVNIYVPVDDDCEDYDKEQSSSE